MLSANFLFQLIWQEEQHGGVSMQVAKKLRRGLLAACLSLLLMGLSGCAFLHDGEGYEHKPGETEIKHKH
tara:strand:- start:374 stop:583 length:210 start_codon:yes stop_codon:yes gene_type:complete